MFHVPEKHRITDHPILASSKKDGNNGAFFFPRDNNRNLIVIASDGESWNLAKLPYPAWEHVSVQGDNGNSKFIPNWTEMCEIKDIFWDEEDVVIQFHPRKSEYVNVHKFVLHLWRPIGIEIPTPPMITIG